MGAVSQQQLARLLCKVCVKQTWTGLGVGVVGMREPHWWEHDDLWKLAG